jgi:hypothetical protein
MLKIRTEQYRAFQPLAEAAFVAEVVEHLRETRPDEVVRLPGGQATIAELPDDILSKMVRRGIARARQYGITWRSTLLAFVTLMLVSAPNFDDHPSLRRVLFDCDIDPDERLDKMIEDSTEENWMDVERAYNAGAWGLNQQEVN